MIIDSPPTNVINVLQFSAFVCSDRKFPKEKNISNFNSEINIYSKKCANKTKRRDRFEVNKIKTKKKTLADEEVRLDSRWVGFIAFPLSSIGFMLL